ncbi:endolytic transglycosylase MltG [Methyloceanibacter sp.]|uniref:endolytic transglycosylase MltG n=1 Tax=Methyloceanibacter sp. TaxID=1965321 RepID=UPI002D5D5C9D|nr:endolytic transglycosylase MltG [Methyloceanibacter sp.]HZP07989.1 endolytic transglycosylase MltG [Methyloceanibacter sp.]
MSLTKDFPPTANDTSDGAGATAPGGPPPGSRAPRSPAETLEPMRPPPLPEREETEERDHPFLNMLDGLVSFVFVLACLALGLYVFVKVQFDKPGPLATSIVFAVPRGEGVSAMAERLEREGVIDDRPIFMTSILYFKYIRGTGSVKAGEYEFPKNATMRDVLDVLVQGRSIEHKVTFAEGLTTQQIVDKLKANPDLHGDITEIPPEGSLLPDTYKFGRDDTRQDIIDRMRAAQAKFLAKVWEERDADLTVSTPEEALVLASIVEKETGRADERPHIASVFLNRLRKNMRLQSDPTIIYGLVGGKGVLDHPIQQDELDRDTPYNTYKINGLPPTPIACPGRASIEAVLKPAKTKDLYFVADGSGGHVFAASLEEHNKNVVKWRKIEREIRAKEAAEAAAQQAAAAAAGQGEAAGSLPPVNGAGAPTLVPDATGSASTADDMPGTFADPGALVDPGAVPAGAAAGGGAVPKPLRNPKR